MDETAVALEGVTSIEPGLASSVPVCTVDCMKQCPKCRALFQLLVDTTVWIIDAQSLRSFGVLAQFVLLDHQHVLNTMPSLAGTAPALDFVFNSVHDSFFQCMDVRICLLSMCVKCSTC